MKKSLHLAVLSTLFVSHVVHAKVIYGVDGRMEIYEASALQQKIAASAATMISENEMTRSSEKPGLVQFSQRTLRQWLEAAANSEEKNIKKFLSPKALAAAQGGITFCEGERFTEQPNPGMCSGFLIGPDLIATAGHCAELPTFCSEYKWVFDFKVDKEKQTAGVDIKEENIYGCKKVITNALSMPLGLDYAIVQLDRRVKDRTPLEIRNDSNIEENAPLFVVGSPSGLPLKVAGGANVRETKHPFYFRANLDTFQGNSGSGVYNAITGVVEGILVRGEDDFEPNRAKMCIEAKKCANDQCRGEEVSRLTSVPEIGIQRALNQAALTGNVAILEKLLKLNTYVDFYTKDGQTALMKAVQGAKVATAKMLIAKGADVNLQDADGNTAGHHLAKILSTKSAEVLSTLIASGLDLEVKNYDGETALMVATRLKNAAGAKLILAAKPAPKSEVKN